MVRIFQMLPGQDLKTMMLVCRAWKVMGEDPTLWTWLKVTVNSREDFLKLKMKRFQLIQGIFVGWKFNSKLGSQWKEQDWAELFKVMLPLKKLKGIDGDEFINLSFVNPEMLVTVFQRFEELVLGNKLSLEQSEHLFSAIADNKSNLKNIYLGKESTVGLEPQLFASAVSQVPEVFLYGMRITQEQMVAVFEAIIREEDKSLWKLSMFSCTIEDIEPGLVGEALNRLEEISTGDTHVTGDQIKAILVRAVGDQSKLKRISLDLYSDDGFDHCDPGLLKMAEDKFGRFYHWEEDIDGNSSYEDISEEGDDDNSDEDNIVE